MHRKHAKTPSAHTKAAGLTDREILLNTSSARNPDITNSHISLNKHEQKLRQLRHVQGPMRPRQEGFSVLAMSTEELNVRESWPQETDEENDAQHRQFKPVATGDRTAK